MVKMIMINVRTGEQVEVETGEPEPIAPPPSVEDYSAAVQAHVDAVAQSRDYRHGDALAGHVNDPKPEWAAEAAAFVNWRSAVWAQVYGMWASPPDPVPTPAEVVAGLPVIEWPEVGE